MEENNIITIQNLIDRGLNNYVNYEGKLVVMKVEDVNLFKYPCHLKATTILICVSGELEGSVNLRHYTIKENSILINFPDNIIQIHSTKNLKAIAVLISSEYLDSLSIKAFSRAKYYMDIRSNVLYTVPQNDLQQFLLYYKLMMNSFNLRKEEGHGELMSHLLSSFLINVAMIQHVGSAVDNKDQFGGSNAKSNVFLFERFIELVNKYHSTERELRFYADKMCITPKYLSVVIKKTSGKKALDWINEFVIIEAQSLLKYSGKSIQEISFLLNFPTQSSFGKFFKIHVGVSPKAYIEQTNGI